jgi:hypothetical protein
MLRIWVAGNGNWGVKVRKFLENRVGFIGHLTIADIKTGNFKTSPLRLLWITYPPGDRKIQLILAALNSGFHVLIEKPLMLSQDEIDTIQTTMLSTKCNVFVNFQYNYCKSIISAKERYAEVDDLLFEGCFYAIPKNKLNLNPYYNLACHIISIKLNHFPNAYLGTLKYGYERNDRCVRLIGKSEKCLINLSKCTCNTLENLLDSLELSLMEGINFPLTFRFGVELERLEIPK